MTLSSDMELLNYKSSKKKWHTWNSIKTRTSLMKISCSYIKSSSIWPEFGLIFSYFLKVKIHNTVSPIQLVPGGLHNMEAKQLALICVDPWYSIRSRVRIQHQHPGPMCPDPTPVTAILAFPQQPWTLWYWLSTNIHESKQIIHLEKVGY